MERVSTSSRPLQSQTNYSRSSSPSGISVEPVDHLEDLVEVNQSLPDDNESGANEIEQEVLDQTCIEEPRFTIPCRKRKSRNEAIGNALVEIEKQKLDYLKSRKLEQVIEPTTSIDEDKNFFFSLLPHVKKIKPESKLLFRSQVQDLVQNFAYSDRNVFRPVPNRPSTSTNSRSTPSMHGSSPVPGYFTNTTSTEIEPLAPGFNHNDPPVMSQSSSQSLLQESNDLLNYDQYHNM